MSRKNSTIDNEIVALGKIVGILEGVGDEIRTRIMTFLSSRYRGGNSLEDSPLVRLIESAYGREPAEKTGGLSLIPRDSQS